MFGWDDAALGAANLGMGLWGKFGGGNNQKNPFDAGKPYYDQIPGVGKENYSPWIKQGQEAASGINDKYKQMYEDPNAFFNNIAGQYKESPGFQKALHDAMTARGNAQAAGGMSGSLEHQRLSAEETADLSSKDFQKYIDNILGINREGLAGGENTANRGFQANQQLADMMSQYYSGMGGNATRGQDWENNKNTNDMSNIFKGASGIAPWLFGGGNNNNGSQWNNPDYMSY